MSLDQQTILEELRSLEQQRATQLETLHRIDGAIVLCRHLLAKGCRPPQSPPDENGRTPAGRADAGT